MKKEVIKETYESVREVLIRNAKIIGTFVDDEGKSGEIEAVLGVDVIVKLTTHGKYLIEQGSRTVGIPLGATWEIEVCK